MTSNLELYMQIRKNLLYELAQVDRKISELSGKSIPALTRTRRVKKSRRKNPNSVSAQVKKALSDIIEPEDGRHKPPKVIQSELKEIGIIVDMRYLRSLLSIEKRHHDRLANDHEGWFKPAENDTAPEGAETPTEAVNS